MRARIPSRTMGLALMGTLGAVVFLSSIWLRLFWLRLASKAVPLVCLTLWLWPPRTRYTRFILGGLALSLLGDLLLEAHADLFLPGLGAFLLAHVAYICAYLTTTREPRWALGAPFLLFGMGAWLFLLPGLGPLAVPVGVYIATICTMMWRSAARVGASGASRRAAWAALTGALCFALSDALLAFQLFVSPVGGPLPYAIMLLYWVGQLGIVLSAVEHPAPAHRADQPIPGAPPPSVRVDDEE